MVRMQGHGMAGELLPLCGGATQWSGGDKVATGGSYETPRTGRGVCCMAYSGAGIQSMLAGQPG